MARNIPARIDQIREAAEMTEISINGEDSGDDFSIGHKFKPIGTRLWDMLRTSEVYFASPQDLNDPFDCQLDLAKAFKLALESAGRQMTDSEGRRWRAMAADINRRARTCGVFSLSHGAIVGDQSHLFWPHYGDSHRGVCLSYCIPHSFVRAQMIGMAPVEYNTNKLFTALNKLSFATKPPFADIEQVITALLTTKSSAWSYEQEFRLVAAEPGLKKFQREWLIQICFGLRVPDGVKQTAVTSLRKWGYDDCTFAEVYVPETGLLDLAIREIEVAV
ncbi:MAG: DUF2971 domain-containing protein [Burkholderiaceae bacterium]|nr:DUF2971 domain-containing protein [Burkholderiaceae bacterium]